MFKNSLKLIQTKCTIFELMEEFLFFKKAQGISERTLEDYRKTFRGYSKFIENPRPDVKLIKSSLLHYFATRSDKAPATFNVPYSNILAFFNWAVSEKYLSENPLKTTGLRKKKDEGKIRHLDESIISKLLSTINISTYSGLRDYAILVLTLDTGIRPKEALSLAPADVNFTNCSILIRKEIAKTRVSRSMPITHQTVEVLRRLNSVKPKEWCNFLFTTSEGNQVSVERWAKRLNYYSKRLGSNITPYDLRHTFAIMFLRNGGNVFALQHMLGHTDLSMTKRYVKLAMSDVQTQHAAASPVNNFIKRTTRIRKLFKDN